MTMAWSYLAYAAGSIALTVWVGRTLKKHGAVLFSGGQEGELALALSDLLAMGFYLFHIGFALLILRYGSRASDLPGAIETVSTKLGLVLLVLAASHFIHVAIFSRLRLKQPATSPLITPTASRVEMPLSAEIVS
ncbi:MAG: hypothetical protein K8T91_25855 [Planctomycetes bacterium]|nr:hypothetical protein [Planctomycetota bacterium]